MNVLYIASDQKRAGKTAIAASIVTLLVRLNKSVGYLKLFSDTANEDADTDFIYGQILGNASAALLPACSKQSSFDEVRVNIQQRMEVLAKQNDVVVVEGPSLMEPRRDGIDHAVKLIELLNAKVLVVIHNDPTTDSEQIQELGTAFGNTLHGIIFNSVTKWKTRELMKDFIPSLEARGVRVIGGVPEDRLLLTPTVGQLAAYLKADWIRGEDKASDLVEHFIIGGNIMDSGVDYFGRVTSKAVIVRGDRPDIQLAALATPTTCLVLTGGHMPIEYVGYEAEQRDVPVIVVQDGTLDVGEALGGIQCEATVHHPKKVDRFLDLLQAHTDVDAISSGL